MSPRSADDELVRLELTVPGQPLILLEDQAAVNQFLSRELSTLRLRRRYAILFLTSKPDNISSLHHQAFKGRKICITERVDLHLVWYYDRIFIKPIPQCLFSRTFRETFLPHAKDFDGDHLAPEADGFLKSYSMLVVHESDFDLAKELRLLPQWIDWVSWCHFIHEFQRLRAKHVARRYHYGEIRLTRLNFFSCLLYGSSYEEMQHNYTIYFARFGAPYVFVFGAITVLLTALQTGLAAYDDGGMYRGIAIKFVPFTCMVTIAGLLLLPLLCLFFQLKELFLYKYRYRGIS
ncbi:hypothetical protein B0J13DRAFT_680756 [Dactylonectria estremocensis]|uniref:Uncharacterized protein n=1 Tax=Dactylonectria estremocensis TaxID=1079267 RepID=A0A9P9IHD7_9HYPO|nr:hypothetical protein B0J13DRAFT_680756 [Dactylonectria estremocensis]